MGTRDETTDSRTIGRFRVLEQLGRGAMGVVYRAFDPVIGRTVALKTIALGATDEEGRELRARLHREACAAGTLTHPNIVTVYDVIEAGGTTAVAMELVEGQSLATLIAERAPFAPEAALEILEQICAAIDWAGSKGIVHRDIKPANILITPAGLVKVADFGLARMTLSQMTQTASVFGSPGYMSPEQVRGQPLDSRSDLFGAAVTLYQMLTKDLPFASEDVATTLFRIVHEPPTPPSGLNAAVSPRVGEVLERALAKEPDRRYQTGAELVAALRQALAADSLPRSASPVAEAAPARRLRRVMAWVGAAGLVAAVALGLVVMRGKPEVLAPPATSAQPSAPAAPPPATSAAQAPSPAEVPSAPPREVPPASPKAGATSPPVGAVPTAGDAVSRPPAVATPKPVPPASIEIAYEGESFPVTLYAGGREVGVVSGPTEQIKIGAGTVRLRVVNDSLFLDRDVGSVALGPGERRVLPVPAVASAFIGVKDDVYQGLQILLNDRSVPEPYPAQIARIAAGPHSIVFRWIDGALVGKEIREMIDLTGGRHFLIRALPDNGQVVVQKLR
jgi:serine/threonine-protein kinase